MPVVFNSISQFVESVGRQTTQEKPDALDTIEAIYTGPNASALAFLPLPKTPFLPEFPLMNCAKAQIVAREGLVAEVRVNYEGKLKGNGNAVIITPAEIDQSRHIASISYTTSVAQSPVTITTAAYTERYTVLTTIGYTVRFTALGVTFRYMTNRAPPKGSGFTGNFVSQSKDYLGIVDQLVFLNSFNAQTFVPATGYVEATLVFDSSLIGVDVKDLDNGWFNVSEQYLSQAFINTKVLGVRGISIQGISGGPT